MNKPPANLVLGGFMGTGKSTVGRLVADRLGLAFVDTDTQVEARAGCTVAELFARDGEPAFRHIEAEVCRDVAIRVGQVVAVGGGALLNPQVYDALAATGLLIGLTCDLGEIIRRVGHDPARPLFSANIEQLAALWAARAEHYARLPYRVDTTRLGPEQAAQEVIAIWHRHTSPSTTPTTNTR